MQQSNRTTVLWAINLASFAVALIGSGINVALPSLGRDLEMDAIMLSWVVSSHLLASTVAVLPLGRIGDIYGRSRIFIIGAITFTLFDLLSAVAWSPIVLVVFRALHGVSAAMLFGVGMAIITSIFPAKERGRVLGVNIAVVYAGLSIGPLIGGVLTQALGWRSIFYTNAVLMLVATLWVMWKLKGEWAEARGERVDYIGCGIYMISLVAIMYGFSELPALQSILMVIGGVIAMVIFVFWERRIEFPVLNVDLFIGNRGFSFANLAALLVYSTTYGVGFLVSLYLQYIKDLSPTIAGLALIVQPIVMAIIAPLSGMLSDRVDPRIMASVGVGLVTCGIVSLIFVNGNTHLFYIITGLIVLGAGFGLFTSPNTNAIMGSVQRRYYGVATGTLATMRTLGQTFSLAVVTMLFALLIGREQIKPENYAEFLQSMKITLIIFAVLCFLGIFASLARGKRKISE